MLGVDALLLLSAQVFFLLGCIIYLADQHDVFKLLLPLALLYFILPVTNGVSFC